MSQKAKNLVALDVGEKRIGVATADTGVRIAIAFTTIEVDGTEIAEITKIVRREDAQEIIIGYPRNQSGAPTAQTTFVEQFAKRLKDVAPIKYQDESLTSVHAEEQLKSYGKPYSKADIDAQAAALILQDYLEINYAS